MGVKTKVSSFRLLALLSVVVLFAGCATANNPRDPIEPFNRAVFNFNETVDSAVLKPVAQGYRAVLPEPVRVGVGNFFSNLEDLWIAVNQVLQGKVVEGVQDAARFVFNSTFGLFGLIDIASDMGLQKHDEDLGQTLGRWGIESGPYLVIPFLGPSTVRDGLARVGDTQADIVWNVKHVPTRNSLAAVRIVSERADLLDAVRVLEEAALDKYGFIRDSYLQRRRSLIFDGDPPRESAPEASGADYRPEASPTAEADLRSEAPESVESETNTDTSRQALVMDARSGTPDSISR